MATPPQKIKMFSLPESGSDLAFFSPITDQNNEEVNSKAQSPLNPASHFGVNRNTSYSAREARSNEKSSDDPSPSHERNPNPCGDLNQETGVKSIEEPETVTCSENQSHGTEKRASFSLVEVVAEVGVGQEMAVAADRNILRKLPVWASNWSAEAEKGKCDKSETHTEKKKENEVPLHANLKEVIEAFSGDFDENKYADMDLLKILDMKGVVFENPSWWPTEVFPDSS